MGYAPIHETREKIIRELALKKPVFRLQVNTPSTHGALGLSTGLSPSFTLCCDTLDAVQSVIMLHYYT